MRGLLPGEQCGLGPPCFPLAFRGPTGRWESPGNWMILNLPFSTVCDVL